MSASEFWWGTVEVILGILVADGAMLGARYLFTGKIPHQ